MWCKFVFFFFFNDTATTEIYTLSLHDALPISLRLLGGNHFPRQAKLMRHTFAAERSEEHTSELQSQSNLVCRLLLEKKKNNTTTDDLHKPDTFPASLPSSISDDACHLDP